MDTSIKTQLPADKTLTGVFTDRNSAERAYHHLMEMGYSEEEVTILMSDEARIRYFPAPGLKGEVVGDTLREGPGLGAVVGATAGTTLGAIIGAAVSLALPGVGLIIAGPLAATLTGAALGGLSGGLLGSLLGIGIPEQRAKRYEEQIKAGNILIGVNPHSESEEQRITEEWRGVGVEVIHQ